MLNAVHACNGTTFQYRLRKIVNETTPALDFAAMRIDLAAAGHPDRGRPPSAAAAAAAAAAPCRSRWMPKGDEPVPDFAGSPPAREGCTPARACGQLAGQRPHCSDLADGTGLSRSCDVGAQIFGSAATTSKSGTSDGSCFGLRRTDPVMGAFCSGSISRCARGRLAHWAVKYQSRVVRGLTRAAAVFAGRQEGEG
eukprot:COSAG02_NODE_2083_length_9893_cov_3.131815_2_plen_196_part_00